MSEASKKGTVPLSASVRWQMEKGWGQATGWRQWFFSWVLWHCMLGNMKDIALNRNLQCSIMECRMLAYRKTFSTENGYILFCFTQIWYRAHVHFSNKANSLKVTRRQQRPEMIIFCHWSLLMLLYESSLSMTNQSWSTYVLPRLVSVILLMSKLQCWFCFPVFNPILF